MQRILFVLCLLIGSFFAHNALANEISNIKKEHPEWFSQNIKPYKVVEDYNSPTGRPGDIEDNSKAYYTKEDQQVLDERKRVLGPIPFLSSFSGFLSIGSAIVFLVLLYLKIDDYLEEKRLKTIKINQELHQEKIRQINKHFIEKVEGIIKIHEASGTAMSYKEVIAIRTEKDNTIHSFSTNNQAEYMIKKHMKTHNPKWKIKKVHQLLNFFILPI
ncbi:hypothetical protein ACIQAA_27185 [Neobacillus sp. NPDC093182]|uniref:hypothetical protein n=1 Tax=Neobacillus sp. NPDC093182 TaxID=3364297 RepID=UPI00382B2D87